MDVRNLFVEVGNWIPAVRLSYKLKFLKTVVMNLLNASIQQRHN